MFLTLMVIGLVGLVMMAIPALGGHGHAAPTGHAGAIGHGAGAGHALGTGHAVGSGAGHALGTGHAGPGASSGQPAPCAPVAPPSQGASQALAQAVLPAGAPPADARPSRGILRFVPSPRAIFSVLALYGAFGNALVHAGHQPFLVAALLAAIPALLIERFAVRPIWNLVFRFQASPSAPLDTLLLCEAKAATPFRNGKGIVSVVREGRLVQLAARLSESDASLPISVGERLRVEDVDAKQERVTVSILRDR